MQKQQVAAVVLDKELFDFLSPCGLKRCAHKVPFVSRSANPVPSDVPAIAECGAGWQYQMGSLDARMATLCCKYVCSNSSVSLHLSLFIYLSHLSFSLSLSYNFEPKELKTKISHTHSLILSHTIFSDSLSHTVLITCTCCYDLTKGTQDKDFSYSFSDSLSLRSLSVRSREVPILDGQDSLLCIYLSLHTHNHTLTHTPYHLYLLLWWNQRN